MDNDRLAIIIVVIIIIGGFLYLERPWQQSEEPAVVGELRTVSAPCFEPPCPDLAVWAVDNHYLRSNGGYCDSSKLHELKGERVNVYGDKVSFTVDNHELQGVTVENVTRKR